MVKKYKYQCRLCPPHIRHQCIQEAQLSPAAKRIIGRAFVKRTDIEETWDLLQANCLLRRFDEIPVVKPATREHGLWSRIHQKDKKVAPQPQEQVELPIVKPRSTARPPSKIKPRGARAQPTATRTVAPSQSQRLSSQTSLTRLQPQPKKEMPKSAVTPSPPRKTMERKSMPQIHYPPVARPQVTDFETPGPKVLISKATGHRILLPEDGELVLGRFDPLTQIKADVDLTFEDRSAGGISRRHARIIGWRGRYEIEDLGSSNGTWINETKLALQARQALHVGDRVRLGGCVMFFDRMPARWKMTVSTGQCFIYVTFTGHYFPLPSQNTIIIGRADPQLGFTPDIDLSNEEGAVSVISRRHVKLTLRREQFMVEDMGSTYKTQLDGQKIYPGIKVPIQFGQHLWLGGYTLAFDTVEKPS